MTLIDDLSAQLRKRGHAQTDVTTDAEADEWRKAARAAARSLGRPVETIQHRHIVAASLKDWPANALEEEIQRAELRNVMNRVAEIGAAGRQR